MSVSQATVMEPTAQNPYCLADHPCARLCAECREAAHRAVNATFCAERPYECTTEPGRGLVIMAPATIEEYEALKAARDAKRTPRLVADPLRVAALGGAR